MKNIVIFSDGTCNEGDKGYPTNVNKLYQAVKRRCDKQVAFYDPGVGTDVHKITGAAFGIGISKNIQECYEFLVDYYEPGAKIFLFGFSRGAYTVRSLAGMVAKVGILTRAHRDQTNRAFKLYKKKDNSEEVEKFFQNCCWQHEEGKAKPAIYFVGVWDTVSALGLPLLSLQSLNPFSARWHGFHDARLAKDVSFGYQALSIDDKRKIFKPEVWEDSVVPGQTVEQVWFAGVHSNVGGGYRRTGLSDLSLQWMIDKGEKAGLLLWGHYQEKVLMAPDPFGKMYDSRSGFGKAYVKADRSIGRNAFIHESVIARNNNPGMFYDPTNLPQNYIVCNNDGPVTTDDAGLTESSPVAGKLSVSRKILANEKWNELGFSLQEGQKYRFTVSGIWIDSSIVATCTGFTSDVFTGAGKSFFRKAASKKRIPEADWFSLICTYGQNCSFSIDLGKMIKENNNNSVEYTATRSGPLYCFANDLPVMYWNNKGFVVLKIEQIE